MKKVILKDRFDTHQKMILLIFLGVPALAIKLNLLNNKSVFSFLISTFLFTSLIAYTFQKRGFIKKQNNLYSGSFFLEILIFKKKIIIESFNKLAVLKLRKSQKTAWLAGSKEDQAYSFNSFEINILNKKHTKRKPIITLKKEHQSNKTIDFLTSNFNLTLETYSPDFS